MSCSTGVVVMSLTCDNASSNWSMIAELGAKLTLEGMNTKLNLNNILDLPILVTLDACHLIKLVRNTLGDFGVIKNSDNETISWQYIKSLSLIPKGYILFTLLIALRLSRHLKMHFNLCFPINFG